MQSFVAEDPMFLNLNPMLILLLNLWFILSRNDCVDKYEFAAASWICFVLFCFDLI